LEVSGALRAKSPKMYSVISMKRQDCFLSAQGELGELLLGKLSLNVDNNAGITN
jgi:hypothetical protein